MSPSLPHAASTSRQNNSHWEEDVDYEDSMFDRATWHASDRSSKPEDGKPGRCSQPALIRRPISGRKVAAITPRANIMLGNPFDEVFDNLAATRNSHSDELVTSHGQVVGNGHNSLHNHHAAHPESPGAADLRILRLSWGQTNNDSPELLSCPLPKSTLLISPDATSWSLSCVESTQSVLNHEQPQLACDASTGQLTHPDTQHGSSQSGAMLSILKEQYNTSEKVMQEAEAALQRSSLVDWLMMKSFSRRQGVELVEAAGIPRTGFEDGEYIHSKGGSSDSCAGKAPGSPLMRAYTHDGSQESEEGERKPRLPPRRSDWGSQGGQTSRNGHQKHLPQVLLGGTLVVTEPILDENNPAITIGTKNAVKTVTPLLPGDPGAEHSPTGGFKGNSALPRNSKWPNALRGSAKLSSSSYPETLMQSVDKALKMAEAPATNGHIPLPGPRHPSTMQPPVPLVLPGGAHLCPSVSPTNLVPVQPLDSNTAQLLLASITSPSTSGGSVSNSALGSSNGLFTHSTNGPRSRPNALDFVRDGSGQHVSREIETFLRRKSGRGSSEQQQRSSAKGAATPSGLLSAIKNVLVRPFRGNQA